MTEIERAARRQSKEHRAEMLYRQYRQYDANAGFDPDKCVTKQWILNHLFSGECKCEYCDTGNWKVLGLDRKNNSKGHTEDNVVPACSICNTARGDSFTYEDFKKITKLVKPINNSMRTTQNYTPTRIEDFISLKYGPNRAVYEPHVDEIVQAMYKGTLEDTIIVVEQNTMEILSGQHRVRAQLQYYEKTGKLYDFTIIFIDLGGDEERIRRYVIGAEADRKGWKVADYIHAFKGTPQYDRFMRWLTENSLANYKVAEWVLGLNAKSICSNSLIIPEHTYEAASNAVKFCEMVHNNAESAELMPKVHEDELYESKYLHIAVRTIFDAQMKGNREDKKIINAQVRMINEIAKELPNGFFDFAKYFQLVMKDAEMHRERVGKKPAANDWIRFIFNNCEKIERKVLGAAKKMSIRRKAVAE